MKLINGLSITLLLVLFIACDSEAASTSVSVQPTVNQSLAKHLTNIGSTMYGAYWCPYCTEQKNLFGKDFVHINYVECDPKGSNPNPALCKEKNITGYPTWEINGKMHQGVYSLEQLSSLSGFETY